MVIKADKLFENYPRQNGFYTQEFNFEDIILKNFEYMKRGLAEEDINFKQPLPYGILVSPDNKVFMYKRGWKTSQVGEKRLYDKVSFWVGWHVEEDVKNTQNPLKETLLREIEEEVGIKPDDIEKIELVWYINDDTNDVWKVHFGLAYVVKLKTKDVKIDKWELAHWEFINIQDIPKILSNPQFDVEPWSKIFLTSYFLD